MIGSRPRSPSAAHPEDWCGPQPGGPGPAKRRRTEEPTDPEAVPGLDNLTGSLASGTLTSVVFLASGCALNLTLDDVDLLLEPEPTSVMQVSLGDRLLVLVPGALLELLGGPAHSALGLEQGAVLNSPEEEDIDLEEGFFYGSALEIAAQEEVYEEDSDAQFLPAEMDAAASSVAGLHLSPGRASDSDVVGLVPQSSPWSPNPSPERCSPHHDAELGLYLAEPFPDSPLQPLPPSPCPDLNERPQRPYGPRRKAQKCLFRE
uniref:Proline-rich protein 23A n=1 Tax=Catagonus wagneri TaxID=51154 RepID=A0A8C3WJQ3_9CETA